MVLSEVRRVIVHVFYQNFNRLVHLQERVKHSVVTFFKNDVSVFVVVLWFGSVLTDLDPALLHWTQTTRAAVDRD